MKRILLFLFVLLGLLACSKKTYLERSDEDKALLDAVKQLAKNNSDQKAAEAIPILYSNIRLAHLAGIRSLENGREISRWDKIVRHYEQLQEAYDAITTTTEASKLVRPEDFSATLNEKKNNAAEEYYKSAESFIDRTGRDNIRKAYNHYRKADKFVPGFRDARAKMDAAFEKALVKVVVNPVQDNSFFFNNGWTWGPNFSNEYFQQTLLRDLNSRGDRFPARFYSDWEASRDRINADWVVDLRLRNLDVPMPFSRQYSRNVSNRIRNGTDTSGKPIYQTVYATLYITQMSFTARGEMEVQIRDIINRSNIGYRSFRDDYRWEEENATYRGDSRALSQRDWQLINRTGFNTPRQEDIVRELYRRIYPSVRNYIVQETDW